MISTCLQSGFYTGTGTVSGNKKVNEREFSGTGKKANEREFSGTGRKGKK